ncbi:MAG TPA: RDD family protein [Thermoanaerobaculia bacterium]|nr:RDD family protein [Thermoanaerobaculia bacterium]
MNCTNHPETIEGLRHCSRCGRPFCTDCLIELRGLTLCAGCKNEQVLDMRSGAGTGTAINLASVGRRWAALIIDRFLFVFIGVVLVILVFVITPEKPEDPRIFGIAAAILGTYAAYVCYDALMVRRNGQTIGKRMLNIRVVRADGNPVRGGQAWGRAITRGVAVHVLALVNYLPSLFTRDKTCVHDLLAGTRVVNAE